MNWSEAKVRWAALGYNQEEFSRKLQAAFPGHQGLSASRLSRKAATQEVVEPAIEQWILGLPPRPGRQASASGLGAGTSVPAAQPPAVPPQATAPTAVPTWPRGRLASALWAATAAVVIFALSQYLMFTYIPTRLVPARTDEECKRGDPTPTSPAPNGSEASRERSASGARLPSQPLPNQARPPCPSRMDKIINGGCWLGPLPGEEPPCSEGRFEHQGGCYYPSAETRQPGQPYSDEHLDGGTP